MNRLLGLYLVVLNSIAFAEAPAGAAPSFKDGVSPFIPLLMIFAVFYFLILRPQQRKQKEQQKFINELKRGDMVVTASGIIGTVRTVSEKFVTLEVDEGVTLKILKSAIAENAANLKEEKAAQGKEATSH